MIVKRLKDCPEFIAGDNTRLREILHAAKGDFKFHYSLARATVNKAGVTVPHRLRTSEVYHILEGTGRMHIGRKSAAVSAGDTVYIPPRAIQYIENTGRGNLVFLCIVDPAWRAADEEILRAKEPPRRTSGPASRSISSRFSTVTIGDHR